MSKLNDLLSIITSKLNTSVKTEVQSFSEEEKAQARENIGAGTSDLKISNDFTDEQNPMSASNTVELAYAMHNLHLHVLRTGVLKWDGIIGNRLCMLTESPSEGDVGSLYMVQITDEIPLSIADGVPAIVAMAGIDLDTGEWMTDVQEYTPELLSEGAYALGDNVIIVTESGDAHFPSGIYCFVHTLKDIGFDRSLFYPCIIDMPYGFFSDESGGSGVDIPDPSTTTEGAFLRVVDGEWVAVTLPNAEDGEF